MQQPTSSGAEKQDEEGNGVQIISSMSTLQTQIAALGTLQ